MRRLPTSHRACRPWRGAVLGNSLLVFDPDTGVTVAVLTNQGQGADHFTLAPALLEIATRR